MKNQTVGIISAWLLVIMAVAGCASFSTNAYENSGAQMVPARSAGTDVSSGTRIREIHVNDVVILHVIPGKEFEKELELTVNLEGEILVPLIGWVKIEGLSTAQAEQMIRGKLDKDFLVDPRVSLRLKEAKSRAVVLLGQLKKPGTYEFPADGKMTLLEAIAKAEGFTDIANITAIKVVRSSREGQRTIHVNAEKIISGGEPDLVLEEGDLITVPESMF